MVAWKSFCWKHQNTQKLSCFFSADSWTFERETQSRHQDFIGLRLSTHFDALIFSLSTALFTEHIFYHQRRKPAKKFQAWKRRCRSMGAKRILALLEVYFSCAPVSSTIDVYWSKHHFTRRSSKILLTGNAEEREQRISCLSCPDEFSVCS